MVFFMPSCALSAIVLQRNVIFALDLILSWYGPTLCMKDDDIFASFVWYMKRQYLYMKFILFSIFSLTWLISASKTFITNWKNRYSPMVYSQSLVEVDEKCSHKWQIVCSIWSSLTSFRDSPRCNKMSDAHCKTISLKTG